MVIVSSMDRVGAPGSCGSGVAVIRETPGAVNKFQGVRVSAPRRARYIRDNRRIPQLFERAVAAVRGQVVALRLCKRKEIAPDGGDIDLCCRGFSIADANHLQRVDAVADSQHQHQSQQSGHDSHGMLLWRVPHFFSTVVRDRLVLVFRNTLTFPGRRFARIHADFYLVAGRARHSSPRAALARIKARLPQDPRESAKSAKIRVLLLSIGDQLHPKNTLAYLRNVVLSRKSGRIPEITGLVRTQTGVSYRRWAACARHDSVAWGSDVFSDAD